MSAKRLFFLHNPKAGGSSLRSLLPTLSGGSIAPRLDHPPNDYKENFRIEGSLKGFDLYFGHCGYEEFRALRDGHRAITNFRDPVQRVYSIYRYWRYNVPLDSLSGMHPGDFAVVQLAHDLSFSAFIRAPSDDLRLYISNFHFRQLFRSGWLQHDMPVFAKSIVKRRIAKMPWFYIAETPEASMTLLGQAFPWASVGSIPFENRSGGTAEPISTEDAEHLVKANELDYEIYAYAHRIQSRRLRTL